MLKKLFILSLLVAVVVAVSYYKTRLNESNTSAAYQSGQEAARQEIDQRQDRSDSLMAELTLKNQTLIETQAAQDTLRLAEKDSLTSVIDSQQSLILSMTEAQEQLASTPKTVTKIKKQSVDENHLQILAYYKKMYQDLPTDLSAYELRVSLSEIREVSARKFSISVAKLNQIRQANGLNY